MSESEIWKEREFYFFLSNLYAFCFFFLSYLQLLELPVLYGIKMMRVEVLDSFHYGLNSLLPPIHMLKPLPPMGLYLEIASSGVIKVKGHHKDGALIWQDQGLTRRERSMSVCLSLAAMKEHIRKPWRKLSPEANHAGTPISDCQAPHPVYNILLWQHELRYVINLRRKYSLFHHWVWI